MAASPSPSPDRVPGSAPEASLVLVDGGGRFSDSTPSEVVIGAVRLAAWQIHPLTAPASFVGQDAYLLKLTYELALEIDVPAPHWFEVGFRFTDTRTEQKVAVLDALPRTTFDSSASATYSVGGYLNFIPAPADTAEAVYIPALRPFIDVFGIGSPAIRWRYLAPPQTGGGRAGVLPGTYVSWIIVVVPGGCAELRVEVAARYDLDPGAALGRVPEVRPGEFPLALRAPSDDRALEDARHARVGVSVRPADNPTREVVGQESPGAAGSTTPPRVFVSYAHDDEPHREAVRALCEFLVHCGLDVHVDRWDLDSRRDWSHWAVEQVREADFVLVVASPMYRRVGDGQMENTRHRGLQSELALVREVLHQDRAGWLPRVLPVVLPGGSVEDIPLFMQPWTADHFLVEKLTVEGAEDLLRVLTGQPPFVRPAGPGQLVRLPPRLAAYRVEG